MQLNQIKAITFDFTGTLASPYPSVGAIYAERLKTLGITAPSRELDRRFAEAYKKHGTKEEIVTEQSMRTFWQRVLTDTILPYCPVPQLEAAFNLLWSSFTEAKHWKPAPHAKDVLEYLNTRGYRLAILSNWDARLRILIQNLGWGHLFQHIFTSSEVGFAKPSPFIFEHAQKALDLETHQLLHVGDHLKRDHEAARRAGWRSIYLSPKLGENYRGPAVPNLFELANLLTQSRGNATYQFNKQVDSLVSSLKELPPGRNNIRMKRTRSIGGLLDKLIKIHNIDQVRLESIIMQHWNQVIGPSRSHRCSPQRIIGNKKLIIVSANATLRQELSMSRHVILENIQKLPGCSTLQEVIVRPG